MTRDFWLKLKSVEPGGSFQGLASTYGNQDYMGDVVAPGAFRQSIASQGKNGIPLLLAHDSGSPLGVGRISDSQAGLIVDGKLVMSDPNVARVHDHLKAGSIRGLSIGFSIPPGDDKVVVQRDGSRLLKEIRLHEISLTAVPANPLAQVTSVKALSSALASVKVDDLAADDRATLLAAMKRLLGAKNALCTCDCSECQDSDCEACSNPACEDPNCSGSRAAGETLTALRALAAELRT